tara:strand:+ start:173 stop:406 length:234 start_codon:yes stop_codon:yes gene_type:complete
MITKLQKDSCALEVTGVRYFQTRRGLGYQCKTNNPKIVIWNDGDGSGTWIPSCPKEYSHLKGMDLEKLIDKYENIKK